MKRGIIPASFLPLQSGVGNIANAVLGALGRDKTIPAFEMYTEVLQDAVVDLIRQGRVKFRKYLFIDCHKRMSARNL